VCFETLKKQLEDKAFKPRVVTALSAISCPSSRSQMEAKFLTAMKKAFEKLQRYLATNKDHLEMWKTIAILDPRNIQGCANFSWEHYSSMFGPKDSEGSPEEVQALEIELKAEWTRYIQVLNHDVQGLSDLPAFWARRPKLGARILPYLWWPVSNSDAERSFSLAALVDTKNRHRATEAFQAATIGMFCNGDAEARFHDL